MKEWPGKASPAATMQMITTIQISTHQNPILRQGGGEESAGVGQGDGALHELGEEDVVHAGEEAVHLVFIFVYWLKTGE